MKKYKNIFIASLVFFLVTWILDSLATSLLWDINFLNSLTHPIAPPATQELLNRGLRLFLFAVAGGIFFWKNPAFLFPSNSGIQQPDPWLNIDTIYPDCIVVHRNYRIIFANQNTLRFFGISSYENFTDTSILDFIHPNYVSTIERRQQELLATGQPSEMMEIPLYLLDKSTRYVSISSTLLENEHGPTIMTFFRDVTEQAEIRKDLIDSRERLHLALEAAQDGVWDWDIIQNRMVYSPAWAQMLGYELPELKTDESNWLYLIHPEDHAHSNTLLQAHLQGDLPQYEAEVRLRHKLGHYIWVLDRGRVVSRDENGKPHRMAGTHRNITARKEAEQALEIRNRIAEIFLVDEDLDKYHLLLETVAKGVACDSGLFATLDGDRGLRVWSIYPQTHSRSEVFHSSKIPQADVPDFLEPVIKKQLSLLLPQPQQINYSGIKMQVALAFPITNRREVIGIFLLGNKSLGFHQSDRTLVESLASYMAPLLQSPLTSEMRELQLRQAKKMEALGALAGGIAHDFNNILQAIMGFTTLARDEASDDSLIAKDLKKVLRASKRGQNLVERILLFSRREEQEYHAVKIFDVVKEAVELLSPSIPATIEIQASLQENCGQIWADPSQINQVIMNLATNAFHAMEDEGGIMRIKLKLVDEFDTDDSPPAPPEGTSMISLSVFDNGCGIAQEELDRVFDPFYTTKEVGRGTGLGLSVVHGIVTNHGGTVHLESKVGEGTLATVYLPMMVNKELLDEQPHHPVPEMIQNSHVLFVDDDEDITAIGQAILEKKGMQVTALSNSRQALEIIKNQPEEFDLVVTDLTMPQMTGVQLAEELYTVRDNLPVILITGLGDRNSNNLKSHPRIKGFIQKPFDMDTLYQTIQKVLIQECAEPLDGAP